MKSVQLSVLASVVAALLVSASAVARSQSKPAPRSTQKPAPREAAKPAVAKWGSWVEPDFPFFSSVLDARQAGAGFPATNLTPRALILNLGHGYWAAFDTDLLRIAAIWRGDGVTPKALAPGSYNTPDRKTPGGQFPAPEPDGKVWMANGIYPGWQYGERPAFEDPREPAPSPEEIGRGPLAEEAGRFRAVRLEADGVVLAYTVAGAQVEERIRVQVGGPPTVRRSFTVSASTRPLWLMLGSKRDDTRITIGAAGASAPAPESLAVSAHAPPPAVSPSPVFAVQVPARTQTIEFTAALTEPTAPPITARAAGTRGVSARRWPQEAVSRITRSSSKQAYAVDDIALPVDNPWRRNIRPGDIQFLKDGTGVLVTLDGDVWTIRGLHQPSGVARWRRFASGLHEPLTLAIRDEQIYVFDRNGIWRLRDANADGEADVHELFSNAFAQTADQREFPSTIRLGPDGEFVIAKGGQEATTIGKHNGSVLRISADGRRATVLGYGLRQPNISVHPRTGLVISSDQQGHYIPTTPLHIVRDRQFYGFLSDKLPREKYPAPIAEPLTWIPHAANASAMSQVWLFGARMGPLTDALVHIGFNNAELFRVMLNERATRPQAAVVSITRAFDYPTLNGSVNPADGLLYIAGFQIFGWGTTAPRLAGLGRVRYTGAPSTVPREVIPMDSGVLVRFDVALDPSMATNPDNYSVTAWQYKRTYQYGSPQFKADGTPGIDRLAPSRAYLSDDRRGVFVAVPGMRPVMQMRVGWSLATAQGARFQDSAYTTPYDLPKFDSRAEKFGDIKVDLTPRAVAATVAGPVTAEEGKRLAQLYGCIACHAIDSATVSKVGPVWNGLYGSERTYAKGVLKVRADEAYLRESILEPTAKVVAGYERGEWGMPSYAGVLTPGQIDAIILFIKTVK